MKRHAELTAGIVRDALVRQQAEERVLQRKMVWPKPRQPNPAGTKSRRVLRESQTDDR
jgi:hypothetical protein